MVTINLSDSEASYIVMVLQARHDTALQRELHAHSRGDLHYSDKEAELTRHVLLMLADEPRWPKNDNPKDLASHPDYCAEHGGHLRDSPACEMAKLRARVQGANPQQ